MIKRKLVILFILISPLLLFGEPNQYTTYSQDTIIFNRFNDSLRKVMFQDFNQACFYIDTMESISAAISFNKGLYIVQNSKGIVHYMKGDYKKSIVEYRKGFLYANKDVPKQRARINLNISLSYKTLTQYDSAIYYLNLAGDLADKYHLDKVKIRANIDRGALYLQQEDYVNAASYLLKDLDQIETSHDTNAFLKFYKTF